MHRRLIAILVAALLMAPATIRANVQNSPVSQDAEFTAITRAFNDQGYALRQSKTDEERESAVLRVEKLTQQLMDLAKRHQGDVVAMDALTQVCTHEIWMENNTTHRGQGQDSPEVAAIAILLRDHVQSDHADYTCWRLSYGFRKECETYIRSVLASNPSRKVRGLACLRLALLLNDRIHRLELLKERPEMVSRYKTLYGSEYVDTLMRSSRTAAIKEVEGTFELAARQFADVELPFGGTVGEQSKSELYEIRHLIPGKPAPQLAGEDQDSKRLSLKDYRGKIVLLYFWSEY